MKRAFLFLLVGLALGLALGRRIETNSQRELFSSSAGKIEALIRDIEIGKRRLEEVREELERLLPASRPEAEKAGNFPQRFLEKQKYFSPFLSKIP